MTSNHPLPSEILFFKIILDTTLQHGKLKIPNKFTREYGGNLSSPLFLKPPDGIEWEIHWTKDGGGGIWLHQGWKEFATYYSLSYGHLVLFKYQETCHLEVHILDRSTLEIKYPFRCTQNENENLHHINNDSIDEVTPSQNTQLKSTSGPQPRKKLRTPRSRGVVGQSSNLPQHAQIKGEQSQEDSGGATENLDHISNDSVDVLDEVTPSHETKLKSTISCPQPRKKLRTLSSGVVGQSSNLPEHVQIKEEQSQGTNFAKSSDKEVLDKDRDGATESLKVEQLTSKAINKTATFRSKAPSFTVVLKPSYADGHSMIIPSAFAKKYLKEKRRDDILFRVLDGRTWPISFRFGRFCTGWKKFASDNHLNVGDVCLFELTRGHCFQVTFIQLSEETQSPVQGDGDLGRIPDLKCITALPIKAMQEARKFTSENPFFTVNIKANCKGDFRPRVPVAFVRKYLGKKQIVMLQFLNKLWQVNMIGEVRTKLSKGWTQFATESKLQPGDVCIFELIDKADAVLDVHVFRGHS